MNIPGQWTGKEFEMLILQRAGIDKHKERYELTRQSVKAPVGGRPNRRGKAPPDFLMRLPDGADVLFDSKVVSITPAWKIFGSGGDGKITRKQYDHMLDKSDDGTTCFFLVHFCEIPDWVETMPKWLKVPAPGFTVAVPVYRGMAMWEEIQAGTKSSLRRDEARSCARVEWNQPSKKAVRRSPDILAAALAVRSMREAAVPTRDSCGCGRPKPATWIMCGQCDSQTYD